MAREIDQLWTISLRPAIEVFPLGVETLRRLGETGAAGFAALCIRPAASRTPARPDAPARVARRVRQAARPSARQATASSSRAALLASPFKWTTKLLRTCVYAF